MTPQELIHSGMLELYVSGSLNETDSKLIADAAMQFSDVKDEIQRIENALIAALENEGNEISNTAKNNIFKAVGIVQQTKETPIIPLPKKTKFINWAAAAMIVMLIGSGFIISMLGKQKNELKAQKTQIEIDKENLETRVSFLQQATNKAAADMEVYRSHDYKKIMMMPVSSSNHEMACVYLNPVTHKLFVDNCGLPNPGNGKTYQLWAMKNGKPISAGLFNQEMYNSGLQEFAAVDSPESFAVTIENKGGATEPTLSALQVAGKI
jgi:hypothetical protein